MSGGGDNKLKLLDGAHGMHAEGGMGMGSIHIIHEHRRVVCGCLWRGESSFSERGFLDSLDELSAAHVAEVVVDHFLVSI